MVTFNQVDLKNMNIPKFCRHASISVEEFHLRLKKDWKSGKFSRSVPFVFDKKLSIEKYALLQESTLRISGLLRQVRNIRGYPYHAGAHVLGYISKVGPTSNAATANMNRAITSAPPASNRSTKHACGEKRHHIAAERQPRTHRRQIYERHVRHGSRSGP